MISKNIDNLSRRNLLKTAAIAVASSTALLSACKPQSPTQAPNDTAPKQDAPAVVVEDRYDCFGVHQAGITTPHQMFGNLTTFDLTITDRNRLIDYFRIEFLTQGGEIKDTDPRLPPEASGLLGKTLRTDGLTITVSVGDTLFDSRFGLADKKPLRLKEMKRFPNDKLNIDWCDAILAFNSVRIRLKPAKTLYETLLKTLPNLPCRVGRWTAGCPKPNQVH